MVLSITAPLGQLVSKLNAVFQPAPPSRTSASRFDASLQRLSGPAPDVTPGLADRASAVSPLLSFGLDASRAPDADGVLAILTKHPPTNDGIRQAMPELERAYPGVSLLDHPQRLDKLEFADGTVVDVIIGAGAPGSRWGWIVEEHGGGDAGTGPGVDVSSIDPATGVASYEYDWVPSDVIATLLPLDGYVAGRYRHQLTGFDHAKIGPDHVHSMNLKYIAARVFEQVDVNASDALDRAVARLREQGFEASRVDDDKIDFNDGQGPIDVIRNMSDTPADLAWQWLV